MSDSSAGNSSFGGITTPAAEGDWKVYHGDAYRCQIHLAPRTGGGYAAVAATLPGIAGEGATEQEAMANVAQSLATTITGWKQSGATIPWGEAAKSPAGAMTKWVIVHL